MDAEKTGTAITLSEMKRIRWRMPGGAVPAHGGGAKELSALSANQKQGPHEGNDSLASVHLGPPPLTLPRHNARFSVFQP